MENLMHPSILFLYLLITFLTFSATQRCPLSDRTVETVKKCPEDEESTNTSARIKQCEKLANIQTCSSPSKFKYHCLPTDLSGTLVEVCAVERYIYGICVLYNNTEIQTNESINCSQSSRCPKRFLSSEAHLYEPCSPNDLTTIQFFDTTVTFVPEDEAKVHSVVLFAATGIIFLGIIIGFFFIKIVKWRKRRQTNRYGPKETEEIMLENGDGSGSAAMKGLPNTFEVVCQLVRKAREVAIEHSGGTEEMENLMLETGKNEDTAYLPVKGCGDYKTWKTKISYYFSALTDDEVSVLFCFLCSDSGPPDFTDTEWLDLLSKIRQQVFTKYANVTREEAHQTLDRLKSRDYLWEDQDNINETTKDETMYKIASNKSDLPFIYSSYNTGSVYLRSRQSSRKPGEKCVMSDRSYCDDLLILRLQMNILTHVTMEDTGMYYKIHQILNVPVNILSENEDKRRDFLTVQKRGGDAVHLRGRSHNSVDHVTWLWRYERWARPNIVRSCIGLHPHLDIYIIDNKPYRKPNQYHKYKPSVKWLLYGVLLVDQFTLDVNNESHKEVLNILRERYFTELTLYGEIIVPNIPSEITNIRDNRITFISDDIRHDVMYAFVTECLVEGSDLEFFLTTASRDVISEYCRSWDYKKSEGERCLYVPDRPEKMHDLFIDKLQLDIISHCTLSDERIHDRISIRLNIPKEVLGWDTHARERFVKNLQQKSVKMFRARGMIVGCAGAGKTTLLRKLHERTRTHTDRTSTEKRSLPRKLQGRMRTYDNSSGAGNFNIFRKFLGEEKDEDKPTETTIGIEVHEDLFVIEDNMLKEFSTRRAEKESQYLDNNVVSMTDFAGQVAYYACHQVYLSRRAFYIVVIDMSKKLDEECRLYDTDRHNPTGSLFHFWTYRDFFHFWIQTINTYCNDGMSQRSAKNTTAINDSMVNVNFPPVILVASHKDKLGRVLHASDTFYSQLEESLYEEQSLRRLLSPYRYFEVECPSKALTPKQQMSIDLVKKCIVETVQKLPHWGEEVPLKWFELEKSINEKKRNGEKILKWSELKETARDFSIDEDDLHDVLRFLHEIGKIIHFSVDKFKETIIIDVQWFVDAFKYIITDEKHFARKDNINVLVNTGRISGRYIEHVWESIDGMSDYGKTEKHHAFLMQSYTKHKDDILKYMDKLGLMTKIESQAGVSDGNEVYYIPSMNRTDLSSNTKYAISQQPKSSMMLYFFKYYLPHFFFFRLVVACFKKWKICDEDSFFKNAAFYRAEETGHYFVIAVSKTSIQLQVFTRDEALKEECVKNIRKTVEGYIKEITETFHKGIIYDIGFSCKDIKIADEDVEFFLKESDITQEARNSMKMSCPRHFLGANKHKIDTHKILMCLFERKSTSSSSMNN